MTDATLVQAAPYERPGIVLGCGVSAAVVGHLAQSPRFRERMAGLIASRLGEIGDLSGEQARVLAMQPDQLTGLSIRAGVVWHAGAILRIVDGASRRSLVALLGERNYQLARLFRGLQPSGVTPDRAPEDIAKAVPIDGAACLAAWCESQHRAVAARLRLTRPAATPEPAHEAWGLPIIVALLGEE